MEASFYNIRRAGLIGLRYAVENADGTYSASIPVGLMLGVLAAIAVVAYLIGSVNTALILSRLRYHADVRKSGSGNAGATNMLRTYGKGAAGLTLLGDVLKGVVAYFFAATLLGEAGGYVAGLFCILGHAYPLYFHFKGGKGVATAAGVVLCLSPLVFVILLLVFVLIVWWTKYISLGSMIGILMFPVLVNRMEAQSPFKGICSVLIAVLIVYLHRGNIERLLHGKENKIHLRKKKPAADAPAQDAPAPDESDKT